MSAAEKLHYVTYSKTNTTEFSFRKNLLHQVKVEKLSAS